MYRAGLRTADYLAVYLSTYFGWGESPGNWGIISSLLMQYVAPHAPKNTHAQGPGSFESYQFVDDGGFAEPALGIRPWVSVRIWEIGLSGSLCRKALNNDKNV